MSTSNKDAENANILEEIDYGKEHLESEGSDEGGDEGQDNSDNDENESTFLSENPYQQVHKSNILGCATYVKWMRKQRYFFGLDMELGRMLLYKKLKQLKSSTYYRLLGGRFEDEKEYDPSDADDIIRIRNKKGRRFRLELDTSKDPKKIRELLDICFQLEKNKPDKGFYATLGRSVMQVQNQTFNVASGIIVDMKKSSSVQDEAKKKKKQLEKERLDKIRGFKAVSSLFFTQSDLLKEILGSISGFIMNPFNSKALSESFSGAHFAIGLVFKPISGTIDLIGKSSEIKKDHVIHANVFKVFKIIKESKNSSNKKNTKQKEAEEKERLKRETALQIHDQFMEKVFQSDDEVLYLNRNNALGISQKDIVQLQSLAQGLNFEDVDGTLKVDIQYEQQKVKMNMLLDYYIRTRKEKAEEYEEDMCEFIVLQPIHEKSATSERVLKVLDYQKSFSSTFIDEQCDVDLEEIGDVIGDERVGDCINKQIPLTTNYHSIEKRETFNQNLPQFYVRDSPFKVRHTTPSILLEYHTDATGENDISKKNVKIVEEGQLKIQFSLKPTTMESHLKVIEDSQNGGVGGAVDDEMMQFHSFTNPQFASNTNMAPLQEQNNQQTYEMADDHQTRFDSHKPSQFSSHQNGDDHVSQQHQDSHSYKEQAQMKQQQLTMKQENKEITIDHNDENQTPRKYDAQFDTMNTNQQNLLAVPARSAEEQLAVLLLSPNGSQIEETAEEGNLGEPEDEEEEEDRGIAKAQDLNVYFSGVKADLERIVKNFAPINAKDEVRVSESHSKGGKQCTDKGIINTTRSVGKYIIGEIGRKIISGDFNLTQVSFPIKAMIPKSALQTALTGTCLFPVYMGIAAGITDPVERLKLVITATFANFPVANTFLKPLNPILGETFQATYVDGTKLYGEQISHHPPVSYFLAQGPEKSYNYSGYYLYEAKAGWNSLTLRNKGKRTLVFKDGHRINYNFGYEYYSGTFLGTMKHETLGEVLFEDPVNKIEALIVTGKVKKKPTDYLQGEIKVNGKVVSTCIGSYLGFIEFDGKRYWDFRHILPMKMNVIVSSLQSDHLRRTDRKFLAQGNLKKAQDEKERLEVIQRTDASMRKKVVEAKAKVAKAEAKAAKAEAKVEAKAAKKKK